MLKNTPHPPLIPRPQMDSLTLGHSLAASAIVELLQ